MKNKLIFFIFCSGVFIGAIIAHENTNTYWKQKAIDRGFAHYYLDGKISRWEWHLDLDNLYYTDDDGVDHKVK